MNLRQNDSILEVKLNKRGKSFQKSPVEEQKQTKITVKDTTELMANIKPFISKTGKYLKNNNEQRIDQFKAGVQEFVTWCGKNFDSFSFYAPSGTAADGVVIHHVLNGKDNFFYIADSLYNLKTEQLHNYIEPAIDIDVAALLNDTANNKFVSHIICTYAENKKVQHRNNKDVIIENLGISFHGSELLTESHLKINQGTRQGLIGANGCGKSVLLNAIGFRLMQIPDNIDIHILSCEFPATDLSALKAVVNSDDRKIRLEAELEELCFQLSDAGGEDEEISARIDEVSSELEGDLCSSEANAGIILSGLGFSKEMQAKRTKDFSGGWCMRIELAYALFKQPTLLLLDEPTNHLDMEAVIWLENYLSKWKDSLIIVSHSQDFMNSVCTAMVHHNNRKLKYYYGDQDTFIKARDESKVHQLKNFDKEQNEMQKMKDFIAKFGHGTAKLARQAQSREKALNRMKSNGLTAAVDKDYFFEFGFPEVDEHLGTLIEVKDVEFGYTKDAILQSDLNFAIDMDTRIALVGNNGIGKTTFLKLMLKQVTPLRGTVKHERVVNQAQQHQHLSDLLPGDKTPLEYMREEYSDVTLEKMRAWIGRQGIKCGTQTTKIKCLSDGQKSRMVFAHMAMQSPNVLILDEPTNHLDIETIDALADALCCQNGGVFLVSHDMRLIEHVAEDIYEVENHTLKRFKGGIKEYKQKTLKKLKL